MPGYSEASLESMRVCVLLLFLWYLAPVVACCDSSRCVEECCLSEQEERVLINFRFTAVSASRNCLIMAAGYLARVELVENQRQFFVRRCVQQKWSKMEGENLGEIVRHRKKGRSH